MANMQMGILGRKAGMTQFFNSDGDLVPVTVVEATPNVVLQVKSAQTADGYASVQIGAGEVRASRLTKAAVGHAAKAGTTAKRLVRELRQADSSAFTPGQVIAVDMFTAGEFVDVTGTSKGKGFAGVMKRHHFAGFESSHGTHEYFRHGGSIGTRLTPGMTLAGKKMPGHLGAKRVTVQNVKVVGVDAEKNLIYLRGGVPGAPGSIVMVRRSVKSAARAAAKAKKGK